MSNMFNSIDGVAAVMFEKACFDERTIAKLERIGYFHAPASKGHHLANPGGLLQHSVNVTLWLERLTKAGVVTWQYEESPYRIGLLHDLVKCKCYVRATASPEEPIVYLYQPHEWPGHGAASALIAMSKIDVGTCPIAGFAGDYYRIHFEVVQAYIYDRGKYFPLAEMPRMKENEICSSYGV